jgi:nucleoside 2-deoxyribosyltransferase
MKIYVAAPWVARETAGLVASQLEQRGHVITERWWDHHDVGVYPGPAYGEDLAELRAQADRDIAGVESADVVVVLQLAKSEGKAVEQGIAIALGIPIVVYSPLNERGHLFHYREGVEIYNTLDDLYEALGE